MSYRCRGWYLALAALLVTGGCASWRAAPMTGATVERLDPKWGVLRLHLADSTVVKVIEPRMTTDSLFSRRQPARRSQPSESVNVALRDVVAFEVQKMDQLRTTLLVSVIVLVLAAGVVAGSLSGASLGPTMPLF